MKPTFKNKEEYLTWVSTWKKNYADLSAKIRALKLDRKDKNEYARAVAQTKLCPLRKAAFEQCLARAEGKLEAQRQDLAERAKLAAVAA